MAKKCSINVNPGDFLVIDGEEHIFIGLEDGGSVVRLVNLKTNLSSRLPLENVTLTAWRFRDANVVQATPETSNDLQGA